MIVLPALHRPSELEAPAAPDDCITGRAFQLLLILKQIFALCVRLFGPMHLQ